MIALAILAGNPPPVSAQDVSTRPLRDLFGPPVQTIKRALQGERSAAPAKPATAAKAPEAADTEAAPAPEEPAVSAAAIPNPRARPASSAAVAYAPEIADPAPVVESPAVEAADSAPAAVTEPVAFDDRFEPPAKAAALAIPTPRLRSAAPPRKAGASQLASLPPKEGIALTGNCKRNLRALGIVAESVPPIRKGSCGIPAPTKVSALDGGDITMTQDAVLACRTAETLATWMRESVEPAARQYFKDDVEGIRVAASYTCRSRNGVDGAKLSEHAKGNAIDISAFKIAGVGWVEVGNSKGMASNRFLKAVRKSACGPFTTVLGPGSDRYHSDHFHLDVAVRGKSGRSLYCK